MRLQFSEELDSWACFVFLVPSYVANARPLNFLAFSAHSRPHIFYILVAKMRIDEEKVINNYTQRNLISAKARRIEKKLENISKNRNDDVVNSHRCAACRSFNQENLIRSPCLKSINVHIVNSIFQGFQEHWIEKERHLN